MAREPGKIWVGLMCTTTLNCVRPEHHNGAVAVLFSREPAITGEDGLAMCDICTPMREHAQDIHPRCAVFRVIVRIPAHMIATKYDDATMRLCIIDMLPPRFPPMLQMADDIDPIPDAIITAHGNMCCDIVRRCISVGLATSRAMPPIAMAGDVPVERN